MYYLRQRFIFALLLSSVPFIEYAIAEQPTITKQGDRWWLARAITLSLPSGASRWETISQVPLIFGAMPIDKRRLPLLTVACANPLSDKAERLSYIEAVQQETDKLFASQGVTESKGNRFEADGPPIDSVLEGKKPDGRPLVIRTRIRFDQEGTLTFRSVGTSADTLDAMKLAEAFEYIDTKSPLATPRVLNRRKPSMQVEVSFQQYVKRAISILRRSNAKEAVEFLLSPKDLSELRQSDSLEELYKTFDAGGQEKTAKLLESLDWTRVRFDAQTKTLDFQVSLEGKRMFFEQTNTGWRMKN